jgi:hypothetical protein
MQNLAKKQWGPSLTLKESADIMIDWCIRAREKNVLRKKPAQIFYAYILDDTPALNYFQNISVAFRYSQKDVPYMDFARDILLRELSVALKAHYFLFADDCIAHEPYFFTIPSLSEHNLTSFGLIYKVEKENKVILVSELDLSKVFTKSKALFEFPVVVIEDSFKWYHTKNWSKIKLHNKMDSHTDKPWVNKKMVQDAKDAATTEELLQYATILEVPYEIKDEIKPLGIEWNNKVKTWYLPKGFDVDSVLEYITHVKKEFDALPKTEIKKDGKK